MSALTIRFNTRAEALAEAKRLAAAYETWVRELAAREARHVNIPVEEETLSPTMRIQ